MSIGYSIIFKVEKIIKMKLIIILLKTYLLNRKIWRGRKIEMTRM